MRVLLIEDNPGDVRLIQESLRTGRDEFTIEIATHLGQGLEHLRSHGADVVLLDLGLPDSLGLETLTTLKGRFPHVPVVVMTSADDEEMALEAVRLGADDYLVKGQTDDRSLRRGLAYAVEREKTRRALAESEAKYRMMAETAAEGIWLTEAEGKVVFCNARLAEMLGRTQDEVLGKHVFAFLFPEDRPAAMARFEERKATGSAQRYETRLRRRDGSEVFALLSAMPLFDGEGGYSGSLTMITDITERKRAEQALAESEHRYRSLFENMMHGLAYCKMLFDDSGRPEDFIYLDVNDAFARLTGLQDVVGKRVTEAIPGTKESHPELFEAYGRVARTGQPEWFEIEFKPLGIWLSISVYSPQKEHFVAIFDNITERRQAEALLAKSEERFRTLAEQIGDAVYRVRVRPERAIEYMNPACAALTGYTLEELYQPAVHERLMHPEDAPIVEAFMQDPASFAKPFTLRWVRKDGAVVWLEHVLSPAYDWEGQVVAIQGTARDVTERRQAEEQVEKLRNQFLAMVSHELRTPITVIKGAAATLLERRHMASEDTRDMMGMVSRQADRLRDLVNDLLEMSRIQAGAFTLEPRPTDMKALINDAVAGFSRSHGQRQVEVALPEDIPSVRADAGRLTQVLLNLLSNADKASPPQAPIEIDVEQDGIQMSVHVRDRGRGIAANEMSRLFKPFSRLENEASSGGTGLGLSISKGIVEAHGGRIWATSDGLGMGSRFTFTLPLIGEVAQGAATTELVRMEAAGKRVLAVDDEQEVLRFLDRCLKENGYLPITTNDASSAIELVERERPDLILLDVMLPRVSGFDLFKRIREFSQAPVIFLTGNSENESVVQALRLGADDYITKPFSVSELLARIEVALRRRQPREETNRGPFVFQDVSVDLASRQVTVAGRKVALSATEYKLLYEMVSSAGRVLTHQQLLQKVWGPEYSGETELLRSFIRNLRRKLGDDAKNPRLILTERQVGYYVPAKK